jgi:hypothetical protein
MSFRRFVVELLGVGDWPATDGAADVVLRIDDWLGLEDSSSVIVDPVCLGVDVTLERGHVDRLPGGTSRAGCMWR